MEAQKRHGASVGQGGLPGRPERFASLVSQLILLASVSTLQTEAGEAGIPTYPSGAIPEGWEQTSERFSLTFITAQHL